MVILRSGFFNKYFVDKFWVYLQIFRYFQRFKERFLNVFTYYNC